MLHTLPAAIAGLIWLAAPAWGQAPAGDVRPLTDEAILADARAESAKFSAGLPNYLAQQSTIRYVSAEFSR